MNAATVADPMQLADPRRYAQMESALNNAERFRKKADEWDEGHGFKYHLLTVGLILTTGIFGILFALGRTNPYRSAAKGFYARYEMTHDDIAKAHGLPTCKELYRNATGGTLPAAWKATPAPTRPAKARKPAARATLAA